MSDGGEGKKGVEAEREPNFLLAPFERRFLPWAAKRLPRWILPDDMTALGVLAAFGVCAAYQLSNDGRGWLWVASGLLVVQWVGDSLDGTLARVRGIQRPKYGYYLDHMVDAFATAAIGLGLGLDFRALDLNLTLFDVIGLAIVAVMLALLTVRAFGNLRELAKEEPSAPRL
jgi:phosphatidylglycerophosphate synthase